MRKKRILFCSEATFLNTGYATYTREILNYLHKTGKYEIAELASYGSPEDSRASTIPWIYFPAALSSHATEEEKKVYASNYTNQFGAYRFHDACLRFKPDIVCDIRDFWMLEFEQKSAYRKFFKWCIMPTVDAQPQAQNWIDTYKTADACLTYSDWAGELLKSQSFGKIKYIGSAPPSAHSAYSCVKDKKTCRGMIGIRDDIKIIGTVMRNQRRKLYPDLFEAFRMLLDKSENDNYLLYCHTSFPDMGWDIPELLQHHKLSSKVMFTYVCQKTKKPFAAFFSGPKCVSPFTHGLDGLMSSVQNGISYDDLSTIMQCFDLYVQYANSEGFGLPQVEAAAGGVPVASIDYSAMSTVIRKLGGIALKPKALYKEMETGCMRAVPDNDYASTEMLKFLQLPSAMREKIGFETRQNFIKHFQWDMSGSMWESYFDSVEIVNEDETWLSPPDIKNPHGMPDVSTFQSIKDSVSFLINQVLCRPEEINSFLSHRLNRDLMYGFTTASKAGIYANDSSMISDGNNAKTSFDFQKAYSYMLSLRNEINYYEQKRAEAFGIL